MGNSSTLKATLTTKSIDFADSSHLSKRNKAWISLPKESASTAVQAITSTNDTKILHSQLDNTSQNKESDSFMVVEMSDS